MPETPDLSKPTGWARMNLAGKSKRSRDKAWYKVRKQALEWYLKGKSRSWICATLDVSRQWLSKWIKRFEAVKEKISQIRGRKRRRQALKQAWAALRSLSTRPHAIHRARDAFVDDILAARNQHPGMGAQKLKLVAGIPLSHQTINLILIQHEKTKPSKKRKWRKWRRFQRPTPNYTWQVDITEIPVKDGPNAHVVTFLDDCTRFVVASKAFEKHLTTGDVLSVFYTAVRMWGKPRQVLSDRGTQFHSEQSNDPSLFTQVLHELGVHHIRARPRHPRTCGKIERWHRSFKEEWCDHHDQPKDLTDLQELINAWVTYYNTVRPHWALNTRVPVEAYTAGLIMDPALYRLVNEVA